MNKSFFAQNKPLLYAILVLLLGFALTGVYAYQQVKSAQKQAASEFSRRAQLRANDIEAALRRNFYQIESIANLFASSEWVNFEEFSGFIDKVFPIFPEGRRISVLAHLPAEQVPSRVTAVRNNPQPDYAQFNIFQYSGGKKHPSQIPENQYLTFVQYTYPAPLDNSFIGRQLTSRSPIGPAIFSAIKAESDTLIGFFMPINNLNFRPFFIHISPILKKDIDGNQQVVGLISSSQYIYEIFNQTAFKQFRGLFHYRLVDPKGWEYHFPDDRLTNTDVSVKHAKADIGIDASVGDDDDDVEVEVDVDVGDQETQSLTETYPLQVFDKTWHLYVTPNKHWGDSTVILLLEPMISGLIISFLLAYLVYFNFSQHSRLGSKVKEKTLELNQAVKTLKDQRFQLKTQNNDLEEAIVESRQAAKAKADFLANMSHEIRTPLNGVMGMIQLMHNTQLNEEQQEYLYKMQSSSKHLLTVINDILDYSKISSDQIELERVPFNLMSVCDFVRANFDTHASHKGIDFILNLDENVPLDLVGDIVRVNQVMLNLCSNAIKFTSKGGVSVKISLLEEGPSPYNGPSPHEGLLRFAFIVKDSGIGMRQQAIAQLFDEFTQADSSTTRKYGGTGLGLSISKKLCHHMHGDIEVDSEIGVGSTFTAIMSFHRNTNVLIQGSEPLKFTAKKSVLLLDDNPDALKVVAKALSAMGASVVMAKTGKQALQILSKKSFDMIIVDWCMPGMDGETFIKKARQQSQPEKPLHIAVLSAYDTSVIRQKQHLLDIDAVLQKPCPTKQIFDVINGTAPESKTRINDKEGLAGIRILVAEDNEINQVVISSMLQNQGIAFELVSDGVECLEKLQQDQNFDLILMDIQMPVMDGLAATQKIRTDDVEKVASMPIVALTANVMKDDVENYFAAGMNSHIAKPIELDNLVQVIREILGN